MEMNVVTTPIIALDYLTKGEKENLTEEQIRIADEWAKDWEIAEVKTLTKAELEEYERLYNSGKRNLSFETHAFENDYSEAV